MATIRTTVNLPEGEYEALKALADRRQISFTHGLRQAIQSELFIQSLVDRGAKLSCRTSKATYSSLSSRRPLTLPRPVPWLRMLNQPPRTRSLPRQDDRETLTEEMT